MKTATRRFGRAPQLILASLFGGLLFTLHAHAASLSSHVTAQASGPPSPAASQRTTHQIKFEAGYAYDKGDLAAITYPSGLRVIYRRHTGLVQAIDVQEPGRNKPVVPFVTSLTHTALSQPRAWAWSNGDSASRSFDMDGRMVANEFAAYTYDAASRITGITQQLWAQQAPGLGAAHGVAAAASRLYTTPIRWSIGYDNRNRVTAFSRDGASTVYSYDANSNRVAAVSRTSSDTDLDGTLDQDDLQQTVGQRMTVDAHSNRLQGFTQTVTRTRAGTTRSAVTTPVSYTLDATGAMVSDGLRTFEYDASNRMAKVKITKDGEAAAVWYRHDALGQRVFKSDVVVERTLPHRRELGHGFIAWLQQHFQWLFMPQQAQGNLGTVYFYDDPGSGTPKLLGEYDTGTARGKGFTEYIWLPVEGDDPLLVGMYRNGKFFAIHTDHVGTPRLVTNQNNKPVWQWPYSAFGDNVPTGVLKATARPKAAMTLEPVMLKATAPDAELNHRFPGQYFDEESGLFYNYFRSYVAAQGRFTQPDPSGLVPSLSRFIYGDGDALNYYDPDGRAKKQAKPDILPLTAGGRAQPRGDVPKPVPFPGELMAGARPPTGKFCESPSQSAYWTNFQPFRGGIKTNGETGKARQYYKWDYTHGDIEVYDQNRLHLGSMNPNTGEIHKPPVVGRELREK